MRDVETKVESGVLGPSDIWREKERFTEMEAKSKQEWDKMNEEYRDAILDIVDRALDKLKQNIGTWVPYSVEPKSGQYLEVKFRVVFSDIDEEVLQREASERKQIEQAKTEVVRLVGDLEARDAESDTGAA